jgi:4-amino-4-deoxychorismate lyase
MSSIVVARGVAGVFFPSLKDIEAVNSANSVNIVNSAWSDRSAEADDTGLIFLDPVTRDASIFDLAVMRGDGFFEAISVIDGKIPVSLDLHINRLASSAAILDMPEPNLPAFRAACLKLISKYSDGHDDPMLRILISRGMDPDTGEGRREGAGVPSIWFFLDGEGEKHSTKPLACVSLSEGFSSQSAANASWLLLGSKKLSYAVNMAAAREAHRRGYDDAVFVTDDGYVLEAPHASLVERFGDEFVTTDPALGVLHGTSQQELFAYVRRLGFTTRYVKDLTLEKFKTADAVYQTRGGWVIPISSVDGVEFPVDEDFVARANHAIHYERAEQIAELANDR